MTDEKPPRARTVDMSPEAIDRRLRDVGQLYKLGMALLDARPLNKADAEPAPRGAREDKERQGGE